MKLVNLAVCLFLLVVPDAHGLVFVAQPQESVDTGEAIFRPIADLLTRETGQPWHYQHPDNPLNYVDIIVEDRAELYLGDPHFVGYQVGSNRQRVLAQVPDQAWVLIAPQSSTGKLLGSRVTASFSCTEAPTCALPPPDLGMLLYSNQEVFANNPLRHPMVVSVNDVENVVQGVLNQRCYCGITRRTLLENTPNIDLSQIAVRELQTTLGAAFTVSERVSPALADQIQAVLLSPAGRQATQAMRDRLYGGAELVRPEGPGAYLSSANLLIDEYLVPMNRMPKPGGKRTEVVDILATAEAAPLKVSQTVAGSGDRIQLTVVSWGGAYSASQWKAYHEPFMKKYPNVTIVEEEASAEAVPLLREQIKSGNIRWSAIDTNTTNGVLFCEEGLVEAIATDEILAPAPDGTPASEDFGDLIVSPCFAPEIVFSTTFGYRHDLLPQPMDSLDDVFNLNGFPGKRSLENNPVGNMEWALIADGVPPDQIYDLLDTPEGVERAFAKLDTIKDEVVWWVKGDVPVKLLEEGTATIASAYNGRLFSSIVERNQPISMMWEWQMFDMDGWVVPKGTLNLDVVKEFIRFATATQQLANQTKYISYGPARKSSAPLVGKHLDLGIDMAPHMPTDPRNSEKTLLFNFEWWAEHQDDLRGRFNSWLKG